MSRTKKFIYNSMSMAILQIVTMIAGFITPRIFLQYYGSEVNGLISSISQFISYFTLVEAGLASAAVYNCKFANMHRPSDVTIADFWGIEKSMPDFVDEKGVSLVLTNTKKGQELFRNTNNMLIYRISNINDCMQPNLQYPSKPSLARERFWYYYKEKGFIYVIKKYTAYGFTNQMVLKIKILLKHILIKLNLIKN